LKKTVKQKRRRKDNQSMRRCDASSCTRARTINEEAISPHEQDNTARHLPRISCAQSKATSHAPASPRFRRFRRHRLLICIGPSATLFSTTQAEVARRIMQASLKSARVLSRWRRLRTGRTLPPRPAPLHQLHPRLQACLRCHHTSRQEVCAAPLLCLALARG